MINLDPFTFFKIFDQQSSTLSVIFAGLLNDPKVRYFIGQPQSGGIGLTLTAADYAIYYSNSFDLETRLQSEDRCHRIGTKNNITYIDIEAPKTIDTKIIKALRDKKSLADIVTKDPISMFLSDDGDDI